MRSAYVGLLRSIIRMIMMWSIDSYYWQRNAE